MPSLDKHVGYPEKALYKSNLSKWKKDYDRAYHKEHREKLIARMKVYNKGMTAYINELRNAPCFDCHKQYNPWQMQFDHRDPKTKIKNVATMGSIRLINEEIKKCDLVCANCHANRTYQKRDLWLRKS